MIVITKYQQMWVNQCHKPPMTGNGLYTFKNHIKMVMTGIWVMVYGIDLPTHQTWEFVHRNRGISREKNNVEWHVTNTTRMWWLMLIDQWSGWRSGPKKKAVQMLVGFPGLNPHCVGRDVHWKKTSVAIQ